MGGGSLGLVLGGVITEWVSWRWVLFINVPIAVLVLIGTGALVPGDTERGTLDVPGAIVNGNGIPDRPESERRRARDLFRR